MAIRVGILGSGNIGTDLMHKVGRSPSLELVAVVGVDPASEGLAMARERGGVDHGRRARGVPVGGARRRPWSSTRRLPTRTPSTRHGWPRSGIR
jgi:hypothetical protein